MIFLGEHTLDFPTQPKEGIIASIGSRLSNYKPVNADFYRRFEEKVGKNAPYPIQGDTEYTDLIRPHNPIASGQTIRKHPDGSSGNVRPVIPALSGQQFR
jgi:hypothetical protein